MDVRTSLARAEAPRYRRNVPAAPTAGYTENLPIAGLRRRGPASRWRGGGRCGCIRLRVVDDADDLGLAHLDRALVFADQFAAVGAQITRCARDHLLHAFAKAIALRANADARDPAES